MAYRNSLVIVTISGLGLLLAEQPAAAAVIANWTFENDIGAINSVAQGSNSASLAPAVGSGTAKGYHANSLTQWVAGIGYNSNTAFSSYYWSTTGGDYYEFDISTAAYSNLTLSFDQF